MKRQQALRNAELKIIIAATSNTLTYYYYFSLSASGLIAITITTYY